MRKSARPCVPDAVRYEVLGRVFSTLRQDQYLHGYLPKLDWWQTLQRGWAIEWQDGPFAYEVAQRLIALGATSEECNDALHCRVGPQRSCSETSAQLNIDGVPLSLRALDPIGYEATYDRLWEDLRRETGFQVTPA